jgi:uncharacterized iron-regulated protein
VTSTRRTPRVHGALARIATAVVLTVPAIAQACVPVGSWALAAADGAAPITARALVDRLATRPVVLLGELHDRAEHHRWQLQTMTALHAHRGDVVLAFEMFPRRVQAALDRWIAGELTEAQFLEASDWSRVWGFETAQYLPLLHFARMNRVPMVALNVERSLIRKVSSKGWEAVPESMREGVGRPVRASPAYVRELHAIYLEHGEDKKGDIDDPAFLRFVEGQLTWDRAMAEAIQSARTKYPGRQVIAIMGRGHTGPGAVPAQLRSLGVADTAVVLPWERDADCSGLAARGAEAIFGVEPLAKLTTQAQRPRLGVVLSLADGAVRIDRVSDKSVAQAAGLRSGDTLLTVAGRGVKVIADVQRAVERQAPGTWLPIRVKRDEREVDIVARFPPE